MKTPFPSFAFAGLAALVFAACTIDTIPDGARTTPPGDGPKVVFDMTRRPLPELPTPNDVATFPDPSSRTGRRINISAVAPTHLETDARQGFATLEGWGTFAPLTVAFERDGATPETSAALDLEDIAARTRDYDPADDPFYVVDLTTGIPIALDMGHGNFPVPMVSKNRLGVNDPRGDQDGVMFESVEEGAGLPPSAYRPDLDTDFDGVLDHPNVLRPTGTSASASVDEIITWYERQSDTLILRPVVPMEEMHEYAVVLTDRLHGPTGKAVRSPFPYIHHPLQRRGAERIGEILSDASKRAYYGDVAGTGLSRVAFVWTFTTQPVFDDLRLLRDGMHGVGPFARLATEVPAKARALRSVGLAVDEGDEPPGGVDVTPACAKPKGTPFVVHVDETTKPTFRQLFEFGFGISGPELDRLFASVENVDHFVIGEMESPYLLGDPKRENPDARFDLNWKTGEGRVGRDTVQFWLSVPKTTAKAKAPFPVTMWSHGTTFFAPEIIIRAGYFAKQGIATMGINMPGHGLYLDEGLSAVTAAALRGTCMAPWAKALTAGRHQDLNGDGVPDSGGLLWSAHVFHSRDNLRQSVIDQLQAIRVVRSWDGSNRSDQDYNHDGTPDLAGDFDGDGVPDVGGPTPVITASGNSFGGIVATILGALDPSVGATAPISAGGGLLDLTTRSDEAADSVLSLVLSPLVVAVPASAVGKRDERPLTQCTGDQRSVRFVLNDLNRSREVEIACLSRDELDPGKTIVVQNIRSQEKRCARTGADGRFRVPVPADIGDRLDIQIYDAPDVVTSYDGCEVPASASAPVGRRIKTFEVAATHPGSFADPTQTCEAAILERGGDATPDDPNACQQFQGRFYPVGSALVAPQQGLGLRRQSPELRRLLSLTQIAIEPGDPVSFAPYYGLRRAPLPSGELSPPRPLLVFNTLGDPLVPTATGYTIARAAGLVPFLPPAFAETLPAWAPYATPRALYDALGQRTPNEVLVQDFVIEGLARLERTRAGATCKPNYVASGTNPGCTTPPSAGSCARAISDPDWLSEGANLWDAPHPAVPLRLARALDVPIDGAAAVDRAWSARLVATPLSSDAEGSKSLVGAPGSPPLGGVVGAWIRPEGEHVFINGDPCKAFDDVVYYDHLLARFLATNGRDVYFLSHPATHRCLEREQCPFF